MAITAQDDLFVLTDDNKLFKRDGCTQSCPEGVSWAKCALPRLGVFVCQSVEVSVCLSVSWSVSRFVFQFVCVSVC